jgi:hypothetical protein
MQLHRFDSWFQRPGAYASTFELLRNLGVVGALIGGWSWAVQTIKEVHALGVGVWLVLALLLTAVTVGTLLGIKALFGGGQSPVGALNQRWPTWQRRDRFAPIDVAKPWREVRGADGRTIGMRYAARVSFGSTVEGAKIRLSFFEEVHLAAGGPVIQPLGVVSHEFRKPQYKGDSFDIILYERKYSEPRSLVCGEREEIKAIEGTQHKVIIECIAGNRVLPPTEFAIFPANSDRPYTEIVPASKLATRLNQHRPPPSYEAVHT